MKHFPFRSNTLFVAAAGVVLASCSDGSDFSPTDPGAPAGSIGSASGTAGPRLRTHAARVADNLALAPAERAVALHLRQLTADDGYAVRQTGPRLAVSTNHAHGMNIRYENAHVALSREVATGEDGVEPDEALLSFAGVGRSGKRTVAAVEREETHGAEVDYQRTGLKEWYVNGPEGLEQGFTLERAPEGSGLVEVATAISGDLTPALAENGSSVELRNQAGEAVLRMADLSVSDAAGRSLESSFVLQDDQVVVRFDDTGAKYPVTVDPYVSRLWGRVTSSTPQSYAAFGSSVDVDGFYAFVGAPGEGHSSSSNTDGTGAVYVFFKKISTMTWEQIARVTVNGLPAGSRFGASVSTGSGCTLVVGAPGYTSNGKKTGAAYAFASTDCRTWTLQNQLRASDGLDGDQFGYSVSHGGDMVIIGAPYVDGSNSPNMGAAYIFSRSGTQWTQTKRLVGRVFGGDHFGTSVMTDGTQAFVGDPGYDGKKSNCGRVYVYQRASSQSTSWSTWGTIDPASATSSGRFGESIGGNRIELLVGEPGADDVANDSGAVQEFVQNTSAFLPSYRLVPSSAGAGTQYGAVVRGGSSVAVAPVAAVAGTSPIAIFTYTSGQGLPQTTSVPVPSGASGTQFGAAIGFYADSLLVAAPADGGGASPNGGAAYFYGVGLSNGEACVKNSTQCASGYCVDGVCCNTMCGTGGSQDASDCQACSVQAGGTTNGTCTPLNATKAAQTQCRASTDYCNTPAYCSTSATTCPANPFASFTTLCRTTNQFCDPDEYCTGSDASCPTDTNFCF